MNAEEVAGCGVSASLRGEGAGVCRLEAQALAICDARRLVHTAVHVEIDSRDCQRCPPAASGRTTNCMDHPLRARRADVVHGRVAWEQRPPHASGELLQPLATRNLRGLAVRAQEDQGGGACRDALVLADLRLAHESVAHDHGARAPGHALHPSAEPVRLQRPQARGDLDHLRPERD
eukprot:CAMPEP_0176166334 /NCGR_PEP_ID=MMETSP0120_2-20121206/85068_1 /TAXON_ID=160619 /ORGANISM="Kryptoperidinium foliaceum, Strain CCMP 1326" /LENGTH=176 /DNA_ID=CAMNT_0017503869 /DNA_START=43 /DNA_END=570 /DNA_ORIENTATION=-